MSMDIKTAKDTVIKAGKNLVEQGLIARTWGNVSCRVDEHTMVITPSGRDYLSLTEGEIVKMDIASLEYEGDIKPSSEKAIHAGCYGKGEINFVIHTHQLFASIVSGCGISYIETDKKYNLLGGKVICAGYGLPSTKKLSGNVIKALAETKGHCIIMKNHGALCFGKDFDETFMAAKQLEEACREYIENKYITISGQKDYSDKGYAEFVLKTYGEVPESFNAGKLNYELSDNMTANTSFFVNAMSNLKKPLYPMIDDFAQIAGVKVKTAANNEKSINRAFKNADAVLIKGFGAVCRGKDMDDAKAVSMIVEKNCMAYMGAALHDRPRSINPLECALMRTIYKMKYSKQKNK
ncbi:MAG: class II aldolase/adducin family protein [Clostridia bacterium]|nr:class II aldolase/adducin family protein [Clostridia bacterium]